MDEANEAALSLYRKRGFQATGRREDYYKPGRHALLMASNVQEQRKELIHDADSSAN